MTKQEKRKTQNARYNKKLHLDAIMAYGGKCACCGEERIEFLCNDHIGGGGLSHKKKEKYGSLPQWLRVHGYPSGFRVLCHNCNMSIGFYGYCPHAK